MTFHFGIHLCHITKHQKKCINTEQIEQDLENASTDLDLDEPMVYDACSFYAHNEYELGSWRPARNKLGKAFNNAYHRHFHIADPVEDYDDRVALYSVYVVNLTFRGPSSCADGAI